MKKLLLVIALLVGNLYANDVDYEWCYNHNSEWSKKRANDEIFMKCYTITMKDDYKWCKENNKTGEYEWEKLDNGEKRLRTCQEVLNWYEGKIRDGFKCYNSFLGVYETPTNQAEKDFCDEEQAKAKEREAGALDRVIGREADA